jgi:cell division protease FtsH
MAHREPAKTHAVRYLTGALREFTVVLLAGQAIRFVADACALARTLQPSLIVLEDGRGGSLVHAERNPLQFTVLDEMDGLGSDIDACSC